MAGHSSDNVDLLGLDFGFTTSASSENNPTDQKTGPGLNNDKNVDNKSSDIFDLMFGTENTNTSFATSQSQSSNANDLLLFDPFAPSETSDFVPELIPNQTAEFAQPSQTAEFAQSQTTDFSSSLFPDFEANHQTSEFDTGQAPTVFETSQDSVFDTSKEPVFETSQTSLFETSLEPVFETSSEPVFGTRRDNDATNKQTAEFSSNPFADFEPSQTSKFDMGQEDDAPKKETAEFSANPFAEFEPSQTSKFDQTKTTELTPNIFSDFEPTEKPEIAQSQQVEFDQTKTTELTPNIISDFEPTEKPEIAQSQQVEFSSDQLSVLKPNPSQSLNNSPKDKHVHEPDFAASQLRTVKDLGNSMPEEKCTKVKDVGSINVTCSTVKRPLTDQQEDKIDIMERPSNLNRSMEKSFEDLLHGLDSDSEPDLDEMITNHSTISQSFTDDSFNAMAARNKEKLAAEKLKEQELLDDSLTNGKNDIDDFFSSSSNQKKDNIITTDDWFSTETNEKEDEIENSDEENDFKESDDGNVNMDESDDKLGEDEHKEIDDFLNDIPDHSTTDIRFHDDSEIQYEAENEDTPTVMITQDVEEEEVVDGGLPREDSLDFSVLQDGNQLDVDIGKQKTSLRKKGSLARRKKPTRNSVRNILNSAEDSHFTDSTETGKSSRPTSMNGFESDVFGLDQPPDTTDGSQLDINDEDSSQGIPTSPPAKKPSLSIGTELPGLATKPFERPSRKSSEDQPQEPDTTKSNYSSIGVKLPMPGLKDTPKKSTEDSTLFDKPALKSVPKTESEKQTFTTDNTFDTPKLKRVTRSRTASQKSEESEESSKMFQKPALRNVSSFDKPEQKEVESNKTFVKPSLRTVKQDEQTKSGEQVLERQHTFEKPALRSTPMKEPSFSSNDNSSSSTVEKKSGFDIPALRKTPKPQRKEYSTESDSVKQGGGMFEKPTLKAVSTPSLNRTESQDSDTVAKHTFDKPSLKSVQRPARSDSNTSDKSDQSSGQPSWLKDMKLRRSKSPERAEKIEKEVSTPSWASTAAEKRSKARDLLDSKENQNKKSSDRKALFPDTPQLRKTNGLPLQEDNNRPRRTSSSESDRSEGEKRKYQEGKRDQYVPSWMKVTDGRHKSPSTPNLTSPPESEKMPQWKIDLAQRRKNKKDTDSSEQQKVPDDNAETPSWKLELQKRRKSTPNTPAKSESSSTSKEPEWKRKAEEKRQRLKESGLLDRKPPIKEKPKLTDN